MTNPTDGRLTEIRLEHAALLWALSVLASDLHVQGEVFRRIGGRGAAAWNCLLMRAAEVIAETIPVNSVEFTRADAASELRQRLAGLNARHGGLLAVDDADDADLGHMDARLQALLDDEGGLA